MKNKILVIIGTVLISLCIGFAIPNAAGGKVTGLQVDQEKLKQNASKQFEEEMTRLIEENQERLVMEELRSQIADARERLAKLSESTAIKIDEEFRKEAQRIYDEGNDVEKAAATVEAKLSSDSTVQPKASTTAAASTAAAPAVKNGSLQSKIDANRDKISDADLNEGKALYSAVDAEYISTLMEGGLTPEEKVIMQSYLHDRFSAGEYERAQELYSKYAELMNE